MEGPAYGTEYEAEAALFARNGVRSYDEVVWSLRTDRLRVVAWIATGKKMAPGCAALGAFLCLDGRRRG